MASLVAVSPICWAPSHATRAWVELVGSPWERSILSGTATALMLISCQTPFSGLNSNHAEGGHGWQEAKSVASTGLVFDLALTCFDRRANKVDCRSDMNSKIFNSWLLKFVLRFCDAMLTIGWKMVVCQQKKKKLPSAQLIVSKGLLLAELKKKKIFRLTVPLAGWVSR